LFAHAARSAVHDPALSWTTIKTPHFNIHYHDGLEAEARRLAAIAEEVHGPMVEILEWTPAQPTEVVLTDQTDLANGYTTALPYNQIVLFPAMPGMASSIGDYDDWLKTLFIHEYAHVLGLDPVHGYSKVFRDIFGKVGFPATDLGVLLWFFAAPPNTFLPPWIHEGMAVNMESDLTGRGRLNSNYYRMIFRTDVEEDAIPPIDRFGGDFPEWPSYPTRYIYGSKLLDMVRSKSGEKSLGKLLRRHSSRFPFTIDAPPRSITGWDYKGLYNKMVIKLENDFRPEINKIKAKGLAEGNRLTLLGLTTSGPLWLSADSIAFTHAPAEKPPALLVQNINSGKTRQIALRPGSASRPTIGAGGRIIFSRVEAAKPLSGGYFYMDLYSADARGGNVKRLTKAARIIEADFNAVANSFVGVQAQGSKRRLVRFRLDDEALNFETLLEEEGVRYDSPRWSPDGSAIAFSRKEDKGAARLALLRMPGRELELLTPEGSQAGFPAWSPDSARIVFSWDRTGVFDLYCHEVETGTKHLLTRVVGGAFEPDWSPDGDNIAYSSYSSNGFDISILDLKQALWEKLPSPKTHDETHVETNAFQTVAPPAEKKDDQHTVFEEKPYSPLPRALPTFWLPDLALDNAGVAPGAWTSGADPLMHHKYFAANYWSPGLHRFYGQAVYINDVAHPTIAVNAWKLPSVHSELIETETETFDYWEENRGIRLAAQLPVSRALEYWNFGISWAWEQVARISRVSEDLDGRRELADLAFEGKLNSLAFSILYDSAFPYERGFSFDPKSGTRMGASYRIRNEALGSQIDTEEVTAEWNRYIDIPIPPGITAAIKAKGGAGWGDDSLQSIFQIGGEASAFPIRGYKNNIDRGKKAFVGAVELQVPVWGPFRGIKDLPLFLKKMYLVPFFDAGRTWDEDSERARQNKWRKGAGMEFRAQTLLGYYFPTTLVIGIAHGFDEDGGDRGYLLFAAGK